MLFDKKMERFHAMHGEFQSDNIRRDKFDLSFSLRSTVRKDFLAKSRLEDTRRNQVKMPTNEEIGQLVQNLFNKNLEIVKSACNTLKQIFIVPISTHDVGHQVAYSSCSNAYSHILRSAHPNVRITTLSKDSSEVREYLLHSNICDDIIDLIEKVTVRRDQTCQSETDEKMDPDDNDDYLKKIKENKQLTDATISEGFKSLGCIGLREKDSNTKSKDGDGTEKDDDESEAEEAEEDFKLNSKLLVETFQRKEKEIEMQTDGKELDGSTKQNDKKINFIKNTKLQKLHQLYPQLFRVNKKKVSELGKPINEKQPSTSGISFSSASSSSTSPIQTTEKMEEEDTAKNDDERTIDDYEPLLVGVPLAMEEILKNDVQITHCALFFIRTLAYKNLPLVRMIAHWDKLCTFTCLLNSSNNDILYLTLCIAIAVTGASADLCHLLIKSDLVPFLCVLLKHEHQVIVSRALTICANIALSPPRDSQLLLIKGGVVSTILSSIRKATYSFQIESLKIFRFLSRNLRFFMQLVLMEVIERTSLLLDDNLDDSVTFETLRFLRFCLYLSKHFFYYKSFSHEKNIHEYGMSYCTANVSDDSVISSGSSMQIFGGGRENDVSVRLKRAGAVHLIRRLADSKDKNVRNEASKILDKFFKDEMEEEVYYSDEEGEGEGEEDDEGSDGKMDEDTSCR
ncbi:uncharacterized protein MONOS_3194 [Monocercomonoides exilis]|uniref:uncharacterized protein n=1 Tax=Monocercomonoides exilis TaxID=2049356 RepID=UPI003559713F|nr:hypothetical protein MONOS_3194 [Monocercomonoides exilis]|eukprot:MONOS_3194.1-p1 / transcript=MONOS_3194.1 / gene=MONOS_3194 / organism=Monocercomonoides_exilis_PA203 / gene_product=unspecified product / transcript_product=unspecified product / location=Mono_scaffold00073:47192-50011(-) / protein_length=682 / sequence_SO=supercontig / SO=protein_coding / is_pseudo=false